MRRSNKRKSSPTRTPTRSTRKKPCIPRPISVPRLIVKGGVTVLNVRQCPDATVQVEFFLNPRGGDDTNPGYSIIIGSNNNNQPDVRMMPRYSVGRIQLPQPNDDLTCDSIIMWEAIQVKTEVVGVATLMDMHSTGRPIDQGGTTIYGNFPVSGPSYHFFAVGGDPLNVQAINHEHTMRLAGNVSAPKNSNPPQNNQILDPSRRARCDKDNYYPVELWHPDPLSNENTRYYGTFTGGQNTPPVLTVTNTVTTILLDQNGVGPLCRGNFCYLTAVDVVGLRYNSTNPAQVWRLLPRSFIITFRQRMVKNPYPINQLITNLYDKMTPNFVGQSSAEQTDEVRVYQGYAPLAGDEVVQPPECNLDCNSCSQYQECSCPMKNETPDTAAAA